MQQLRDLLHCLHEWSELEEVFELYIYDICYGFFDASGPAYSLENEACVDHTRCNFLSLDICTRLQSFSE